MSSPRGPALRCVTYSRVSTDGQERDGTSLDTQERECLDLAEDRGCVIVASIRDTASGFSLERPGLEQLRRAARAGEVDLVVAHALDRLGRKQTHVAILVEELRSFGVTLEFVTERFEETAVGQLIMNVKAFAAEFERERIAERTMRGKVERARSGRLPQAAGAGMYGYRYDRTTGRRLIVEDQARVVVRIFEAFALGASCSSIATTLNEEGVSAFRGGPWHPLTIRRLLMNEAYTGRTVFRRTRQERYFDGGSRTWKRRSVERDPAEQIEVTGATPRIVCRRTCSNGLRSGLRTQ